MADNNNPDLGKVTSDAEKLAGGQGTTNTGTENVGTGNPGVATNQDGSAAGPQTGTLPDQPGRGPSRPSNAAKAAATTPITQGNPGALKPGAIAADRSPAANAAAPVARISEDDAEQRLHEDLTREFGPNYITAKNRNGVTQYFSERAWQGLAAADKDGYRDGYKQDVKVPDEVKNLQANG